jgi:hypothetical protein
MLQDTVARATGSGFSAPIVVCNQAHRFMVAEQLQTAGVQKPVIVLEPVARNSAPAIAAAALLAHEEDPTAVLWLMAADAAISDTAALSAALDRAAAAARAGRIVAFGMQPTSAETGYGYIEAGEPLDGLDGVFGVAGFVEKPDVATAEGFLSGGRHLWNSGMFVATAATLLAELERPPCAPRWPMPRATWTSCASRPKPSSARPTFPSITPSWKRPPMPPWCRPPSDGPMSAPGARSGRCPTWMPMAMPPQARLSCCAPRTAMSAAKAS